jgi:cytochrome d ubiquinol oxidase subunit I
MFVLGISAYYLLRNRDVAFARRSFRIAAGFGIASILSVIVLGDESGYTVGEVQKAKLAAIEAEWETEPAPASFTLIGFPDEDTMTTHYAVTVPWILGMIATRSVDDQIIGLKDILANNRERIKSGMIAYDNLQKLRINK